MTDQSTASTSALVTSLMRAAHTRTDPQPLIDDDWADRLIPAAMRAQFEETALSRLNPDLRAQVSDQRALVLDAALRAGSGYPNVIMRARYTEDALRDAVVRGVSQYVVIGAGFDSFALRRPDFAPHVSVFEIDRPATLALKQQSLAECGASVPATLQFLPADLRIDDLHDVLAGSAYRSALPAFFSWLGVSMFLPREANLATLRAIARSAAPGSELVFTYFDEKIFGTETAAFRDLQQSSAILGEPLRCGFDPQLLAEDLRRMGFSPLEDVEDRELVDRYGRTGQTDFVPLAHSRILRARVG